MPPTRDADGNLITYVPRKAPLHPEGTVVRSVPTVALQPPTMAGGVPVAAVQGPLTPSGCPVLPEAATDLESALTLLNGIRTCLIEAGLAVEATC